MFLYRSLLPLAAAAVLAAQVPENVSIEKDIAYDRYPQTRLDILQPKAAAEGKRPGVILIHGGGWILGTKEAVVQTCLRYVEKGFVCANVEYRLAKAAPAPAAVNDVLAAAQWFFRNAKKYNVDKDRVVVTGGSAGGHLSLMVGMTPKSAKLGPEAKVRAVVNFYGITDMGDLLNAPNQRYWAVQWVPEQPGRTELARRLSPMAYARKKLPAILTIHGDADPTVPYQHGVKLTKAISEAGGNTELVTVPEGKHGFPKPVADRIYEENVWPFLRKTGVL